MLYVYFVFFWILGVLVAGRQVNAVEQKTWLQVRDGRIVDEQGKPVLLHGVNLGMYPGEPSTFDATDFGQIRQWGFDVVRIPVEWGRAEPRRGTYDKTYLEKIDRYVGWAKAQGLWVILSGFGWPPWWAQEREDQQRYAPRPGSLEARWTPWLWTRPAFYLNKNNVHERFLAFWQTLARRYADEPAVCLYELLNEPERTGHLDPKQEDALIYRLYERTIAALREIDTRHMIGYMGVGLESLGQPLGLRAIRRPNVCVTYHFYLHNYDYWRNPDPRRLEGAVDSVLRQVNRWHLPLLVTEFGCQQPEPEKSSVWIRDTLAAWRRLGLGHVWWCYMRSDKHATALLRANERPRSHILTPLLSDNNQR